MGLRHNIDRYTLRCTECGCSQKVALMGVPCERNGIVVPAEPEPPPTRGDSTWEDGRCHLSKRATAKLLAAIEWRGWARSGQPASMVARFLEFVEILTEETGVDFGELT